MPVYIVHLSARDALDAVRAARDRGTKTFAETCPQYLFLSLDDLGNGFEGAKFVCSPPLRTKDHQPELWTGLLKDDLQLVSTDHCPFDFHGQKELGRGDFRKIPNGLPGVEDRLDLLHDGGVVGGRGSPASAGSRSLDRARPGCSGMYPRKGAIAVGADADIVVYDPDRRHTISAATHHMDVDYSCYEGRSCRARPTSSCRAGRSSSATARSGPQGRGPLHQARAGRLRAVVSARLGRAGPAAAPLLGPRPLGPRRPHRRAHVTFIGAQA